MLVATNDRRPEAVLFIGVQGSGKSAFFASRLADRYLRISLDVLRTRHREAVLVHAALSVEASFVLDGTHPTRASRASWIALARAAGFRMVGVYFDVPLEVALVRNRERVGAARVPDVAVQGTYAKLEAPTLAEGFDELVRVSLGADGELALDPIG